MNLEQTEAEELLNCIVLLSDIGDFLEENISHIPRKDLMKQLMIKFSLDKAEAKEILDATYLSKHLKDRDHSRCKETK